LFRKAAATGDDSLHAKKMLARLRAGQPDIVVGSRSGKPLPLPKQAKGGGTTSSSTTSTARRSNSGDTLDFAEEKLMRAEQLDSRSTGM
jgi:hypothetical protein